MAAPVDTSSIPALVQRLRSGRRAEQLRAAQQLGVMAAPGPGSNSVWAAIAAAGAIPALVPLMGSSSHAVRAAACATLVRVILSPGGQDAFMAAGGLAPLQDCLFQCSDQDVQYRAAYLATHLLHASHPRYAECCAAIAAGIPTLVRRLGSDRRLAASTAGTLRNLFGGPVEQLSKVQQAAVAAGAVPALAQLLANGDDDEQLEALSALANLTGGDAACQGAVAAEGLIPMFVERLSSQSQEMQRCAALALHNMTFDTSAEASRYCEAAAAAGAIPRLVRCLAANSEVAQLDAARALHNLCWASPERSHKAVAAGAVRALQRAQQSSDEDVQHAAYVTLRTLRSSAAAAAPRPASAPAPAARRPAAASSSRRRPPAPRICAAPGCGATRGLKRCGGCGSVRYCSEACSRADWKAQRAECRRLQAEQAAAAGGASDSGEVESSSQPDFVQ